MLETYLLKNDSGRRIHNTSSEDDITAKLHNYVSTMNYDEAYYVSHPNVQLYVRVFNIFHYWPEFMHPWITSEYTNHQALILANKELKTDKNLGFIKELNSISDYIDSDDAKILIGNLLHRLESGKIYVDDVFFDYLEFIGEESKLNPNQTSRLNLLLDEWSSSYKSTLSKSKSVLSSKL